MNLRVGMGTGFWGWIAASIAIIAWSVTFANTSALLGDFSSLEILIVRFSLAWASLTLMEGLGGGAAAAREAVRRCGRLRVEMLCLGLGAAGIVVYQLMENCAIYYTGAGNVAILVAFGPIATAVMAKLFRNDRSLSVSFVLGSLVAIAGIAILMGDDGATTFRNRMLGDAMALVAMMMWGVYSVIVDRLNELEVPPLYTTCRAYFWGLMLMAPLALWGISEGGRAALDGAFAVTLDAGVNAARFTRPLNLMNLGLLGVLASAASYVLWNHACGVLGVVRTTIGIFLMPLLGVVFAVVFLGERLTRAGVNGGIVIIAGVMLANLSFIMRSRLPRTGSNP